jgi:hypothetical protein
MAAWQFDLHCVPKVGLVRKFGEVPLAIPRDDAHATDLFWGGISKSAVCTDRFDEILRRGSSWSFDVECWGDEAGDRVDVLRSGASIEGVFIRMDVRDIDFRFLGWIINWAMKCEILFIVSGNYVCEPSMSRLYWGRFGVLDHLNL